MEKLKAEIAKICAEKQLICGDGGDEDAAWMEKVIAVPDLQPAPRPHDGGAQWQWEVHSMERSL